MTEDREGRNKVDRWDGSSVLCRNIVGYSARREQGMNEVSGNGMLCNRELSLCNKRSHIMVVDVNGNDPRVRRSARKVAFKRSNRGV